MSVRTIILLVLSIAFIGCEAKPVTTGGKLRVVTTTTMLADLVRQVGGDQVEVFGIMKPGGDPHLYQPRPGDAAEIARADLVITSGLHLEGWIDDLVRNAGQSEVLVASEGIEPIRDANSPGGVDPHFWFDLNLWRVAVSNVERGLSRVSPDDAAAFRSQAERYTKDVDAADRSAQKAIHSIPTKQRVMVTSHDAFRYFGRRYAIEVVGIQGISTEAEASQRDVANVIELVRTRNATAVFVESSVNPALVEQVARETGAKVAGPLYSDSIGVENGPASTFLKTMNENVRMVTEALGGKLPDEG